MSKRKRQQPSEQDMIVYATHEAGHAVVGHVIGRLIDEVLPCCGTPSLKLQRCCNTNKRYKNAACLVCMQDD